MRYIYLYIFIYILSEWKGFIDLWQRFAKITILLLSANPASIKTWELTKEWNITDQKLRAAANKGDFKLEE
jgi:hypothetical protein